MIHALQARRGTANFAIRYAPTDMTVLDLFAGRGVSAKVT
jgi:hypothetical protein